MYIKDYLCLGKRSVNLSVNLALCRMAHEVFPLRLAAACAGSESAAVVRRELTKFLEADKVAQSVNTPWCKTVTRRNAARHILIQDIGRASVSDSVMVTMMRDLFSGLCFTFNEEGFSTLRQCESWSANCFSVNAFSIHSNP